MPVLVHGVAPAGPSTTGGHALAADGCEDRWVLRTPLIGEIDLALAAVEGLLAQCVPEQVLDIVPARNASTWADSW